MDQNAIFVTILGMLVVTYLPRVLPVWLLASQSLPALIVAWLRYIPVAVLAAILLPSLIIQEGRISLAVENLFLWAAIPTLLIAWKTRSFLGAVAVGMGLVAAIRYLFGL
jgi:branched-subunit amino acid transport protein